MKGFVNLHDLKLALKLVSAVLALFSIPLLDWLEVPLHRSLQSLQRLHSVKYVH